MSITFHINVGLGDIAACLQVQTVSDLCQTFGAPTIFHINEGSGDIAAFLLFPRVSDLFGAPTNLHISVGSAVI